MARNHPMAGRADGQSLPAAIVLGLLVLAASPLFASEPPDLSGTWAMIQFMPEVANLPFIGEVMITAVVGLLVQVEQDGTALTMRDTYCHTEVLSDKTILTSVVPDLVMASLDPAPRTACLEPLPQGWKLVQNPHLEVRGAVLESPTTDPLPLGRWDPRVVDMDGDGHPGFTITVSAFALITGDTYVVQRLGYTAESSDVNASAFEGSIEWSSEQIVIGGTDALLMMSYESWHHPTPARHRFVMRRLADDAGYDDVVAVLEAERDAYLETFPQTIDAESLAADG